jgi:4a-hydroxytetrahydrobiopterin dehydratase
MNSSPALGTTLTRDALRALDGTTVDGRSALTTAQAAGPLRAVPDWACTEGTLERRFEFRDFHETMAFVNAVAWIAHRHDHHPDMTVGFRHCQLRYTTHSAGGLTLKDFICAACIDALLGHG